MSEGNTGASSTAVSAPVDTVPVPAPTEPVIETPAAARVTDKLPEQFSATPPHSQAAPALRQGPNPVSPPIPETPTPTTPAPAPEMPPVETPAPEIPQPSPAPQPVPPSNPTASITIKDRLYAALEKIQFRKRAKLDKILVLAAQKRSIKNDDVEKLLRVSDSTAQRYLKQLVAEGRLRATKKGNDAFYEPI